MSLAFAVFEEKSRLKSLLDHFGRIEDPREAWRVAHPLSEVLLLVVCATMADCDDYEAIAAWGRRILSFYAATGLFITAFLADVGLRN